MSDTSQATATPAETINAAPSSSPPAAQVSASPAPQSGDYAEWREFLDFAKGNKWTSADLMRAFKGEAEQKPVQQPQAKTAEFDPEKFEASLMAKMKREQALGEHKNYRTKYESSVNGLIEKIKASEYADPVKELLTSAVRGKLSEMEMASLYDDGHPLRSEHLRPLGDDKLSEVQKWYDERTTAMKAGLLAQIGDAAAKGKTTPAAGNPTPQGKPTKSDRKPWESPDRSEIEKKFEAMYAQHKGAATSALAGA